MAAVPPITLGELSNVPAPGSEIDAAWAQDITRMAVHRFPSAAARDAAWTWPVGRMAFITDKNQLSIKEAGGWVVLNEPPINATTNWPDGTQIWINTNTAGGGNVTINGSGTFQRSGGRCFFKATGVVPSQGGSFAPHFRLPMDATEHHDNKFQADIVRPGVALYPGYTAVISPRQQAMYFLTDTSPEGMSVIGRFPVSSTQPFNWSVAGDKSMNVSGWFQMADRYSA